MVEPPRPIFPQSELLLNCCTASRLENSRLENSGELGNGGSDPLLDWLDSDAG